MIAGHQLYLDTSALVKLVIPEAESSALQAFLRTRPVLTSSALARVELVRAVRRMAGEAAVTDATRLLGQVTLVAMTNPVLDRAASVGAGSLRSLDAIHLATALLLGADLDGMVTYDDRLAEAARRAGVTVYAPR